MPSSQPPSPAPAPSSQLASHDSTDDSYRPPSSSESSSSSDMESDMSEGFRLLSGVPLRPGLAPLDWVPGEPFELRSWPTGLATSIEPLPASMREGAVVQKRTLDEDNGTRQHRQAQNLALRNDAMLRSGPAMCKPCRDRQGAGGAAHFGCIAAGTPPRQACAECTCLGGNKSCTWGGGNRGAENEVSLGADVAEAIGAGDALLTLVEAHSTAGMTIQPALLRPLVEQQLARLRRLQATYAEVVGGEGEYMPRKRRRNQPSELPQTPAGPSNIAPASVQPQPSPGVQSDAFMDAGPSAQ